MSDLTPPELSRPQPTEIKSSGQPPPPLKPKPKESLSTRDELLIAGQLHLDVRKKALAKESGDDLIEASPVSTRWKTIFRTLSAAIGQDIESTTQVKGIAMGKMALEETKSGPLTRLKNRLFTSPKERLGTYLYRQVFAPTNQEQALKGRVFLEEKPSVTILYLTDQDDFKRVARSGNEASQFDAVYIPDARFGKGQETLTFPLIVIYTPSEDKNYNPLKNKSGQKELEGSKNHELAHHAHRQMEIAVAQTEGRPVVSGDIDGRLFQLRMELEGLKIAIENDQSADSEEKFRALRQDFSAIAFYLAGDELGVESVIRRSNSTIFNGIDGYLLADQGVYDYYGLVTNPPSPLPQELKRPLEEDKGEYRKVVLGAIESLENATLTLECFGPKDTNEIRQAISLVVARYPIASWQEYIRELMGQKLDVYKQHLMDIDPKKLACQYERDKNSGKIDDESALIYKLRMPRYTQIQSLFNDVIVKVRQQLASGVPLEEALKSEESLFAQIRQKVQIDRETGI